MKFLVDECLSPRLIAMAYARGHGESSHVVWMKRGGSTDRALMPLIVDGDWTFVTKNSIDFRGPAARPGSRGLYMAIALHAGLICLNGPAGMDLDLQIELFKVALDEVETDDDLVNRVLDITLDDAGTILVRRYAVPV